MKKLLLLIFLVLLSTSCTLRKEGGKWTVKKTIVDEVKESVAGAKELISDVNDANDDLSSKQNTQPKTTN
jgi:hypothetical protein